ncbi:MAG: hypothetical protein IKU25_05400 [Clostridia bacterium]|nr:hypothetical protein [Clostridia bacterium]
MGDNNLSCKDLVIKLEMIKDLYSRVSAAKTKMNNVKHTVVDDYERTVHEPDFKGRWGERVYRAVLKSGTQEDLLTIYKDYFTPEKPTKKMPTKPMEYKKKEKENEKNNHKSVLLKSVIIAIVAFICLVYFFVKKGGNTGEAWLWLILAVALLFFAMASYIKGKVKLKENAENRTEKYEAKLEKYNQKVAAINEQYEKEMEAYNAKVKEYNDNQESFIKDCEELLAVQKSIEEEEADISRKLEQKRAQEKDRIYREEYIPAFEAFEENNDLVSDDYVYAIGEFIALIKNGRADSLKEAINLYEEIQHRERELELQRGLDARRRREEDEQQEVEKCKQRLIEKMDVEAQGRKCAQCVFSGRCKIRGKDALGCASYRPR